VNVDFRNDHLLKLYQTAKSRKYKLRKHILKKFFMRIQELEAAKDIYDLWKPSLNFENLEGYENRYSIRVQDKWRLEFEVNWENSEKTIGSIYIVELSKHYGR